MKFNAICIILITIDFKRKLRKNELFIFGLSVLKFHKDMKVDEFDILCGELFRFEVAGSYGRFGGF